MSQKVILPSAAAVSGIQVESTQGTGVEGKYTFPHCHNLPVPTVTILDLTL